MNKNNDSDEIRKLHHLLLIIEVIGSSLIAFLAYGLGVSLWPAVIYTTGGIVLDSIVIAMMRSGGKQTVRKSLIESGVAAAISLFIQVMLWSVR